MKTSFAQRKASKKWYNKNKETKSKINYEKNKQYRFQILTHYSNSDTPYCNCCKENNLEFLSIDHINGGGRQHRKSTGQGIAFYRWLMKNNFPQEFRVLCMNCNHSLGHYGYCPHNKNAL